MLWIVSIASALIASTIGAWFRNYWSWSGRFPRIVGSWTATVQLAGHDDPFEEHICITRQFWRSSWGYFDSPASGSDEIVRLLMKARFVETRRIVYQYRHPRQRGSPSYTDYGAGVVELNPAHDEGVGYSVGLGVHSREITTHSVVFKRHSHAGCR